MGNTTSRVREKLNSQKLWLYITESLRESSPESPAINSDGEDTEKKVSSAEVETNVSSPKCTSGESQEANKGSPRIEPEEALESSTSKANIPKKVNNSSSSIECESGEVIPPAESNIESKDNVCEDQKPQKELTGKADPSNKRENEQEGKDLISILASGGKEQVLEENKETFDVKGVINRLLENGGRKSWKQYHIKNSDILTVCSMAREILLQQPTLLELNPPVNIVGDIHGQFTDLHRLFAMCKYPPHANYLFLGDYVDRGKQSLETILLLLSYKIQYPENIFLLRGNHECASVNRVYGFYSECKHKCSLKVWKVFTDIFNCLPIAAIVGGKIFCVHGGLSPGLVSMDDILRIKRPLNVPDFGILNDILWSDPSETAVTWEGNERGVSYCFSKQIVTEFLEKHGFDLICRAHMVVEDGYEFFNNRTLVTIFSAPNYCGEFDNRGAVMSVDEDLLCSIEILEPKVKTKRKTTKIKKSLKNMMVAM